MNYEILFWTFLVLMIMHFVGDFLTPFRQLDTTTWWSILLSEWVLVLNPLHWLWDAYSPYRRHPNYFNVLRAGAMGKIAKQGNPATPMRVITLSGHAKFAKNDVVNVNWWFWRWLAVDQLYHLASNLFVAWIFAVTF